ncbi:unnamed protein product [Protopolystoma xenopodis]|uniref:Uncharacterized protein n=1 Tax=Protopolystoma xenopodis TaxID=117903 RepID=A0A3S5CV51_9PLAT|nr:unnamed protein product [Protopolystoma xenopodis]
MPSRMDPNTETGSHASPTPKPIEPSVNKALETTLKPPESQSRPDNQESYSPASVARGLGMVIPPAKVRFRPK